MEKNRLLQHVAFIMDGNGRWAKARNLPRHLGHKAGCERVKEVCEECMDQGIKAISLYAFSTENWNRPKDEIDHLFNYLHLFFKREIKSFEKEGVRVIASGDITKLPTKTYNTVIDAIERTKNNDNFIFNICLNYGGKAELLRAAKTFTQEVKDGSKNIDELDESLFESYLYTKDLPPVDLLIRTSGEQRTSNFLPWQMAYAEFIFTPTAWPDFTKEELRKCLEIFKTRNRRFGEIKENEK